MVFIERVIVNGTLSKTTGEKSELAYTEKKRLGNLELYRKITSDRGQSQIWYKVLYLSYKNIGKAMAFLLLLGVSGLSGWYARAKGGRQTQPTTD